MTFRSRVNLIAVILVIVAAVWVTAQTQVPKAPPDLLNRMDLVAPTVISGSDLGFRIESNKDNIPVGKLVVRIKGVWVDAQISSSGGIVVDDQK